PKLLPLLFLAMFIGGCSGSSAGGFNTIRVVMLQTLARNEIKKIMHPNAVFPLRISGQVIATPVKITLVAFTALYFATFFAGWLAFMFCGVPFEEAAVGSISCLSNMGPGLGSMGPVYSWNGLGLGAKWVASLLMFVGRLELLSVYVIFTRAFWKSSGV
ncbi:MAG: TrkH family potassium uptake protein, partial [Bacteroidales bacterium]|nr:TrkH family potassium uptake protein [Bacteroidales bacterium]